VACKASSVELSPEIEGLVGVEDVAVLHYKANLEAVALAHHVQNV
jgi:hypothetical protein